MVGLGATREGAPAPEAEREAAGTPSNGYLLVVDDEPAIGKLVTVMLRREPVLVREARDGRQALALLREEMPTAILLDINMPVMNGWEFLDEFERLPEPRPPVVVFSGYADEARERLRGRVVAALQKPVLREALLAEILPYFREE
jgi:CheY-like chemotaxis protein